MTNRRSRADASIFFGDIKQIVADSTVWPNKRCQPRFESDCLTADGCDCGSVQRLSLFAETVRPGHGDYFQDLTTFASGGNLAPSGPARRNRRMAASIGSQIRNPLAAMRVQFKCSR